MLIDRLYDEVKEKGNVCVGLDTHLDYIPMEIKEKSRNVGDAIFQFNKRIIDKTLDLVPIFKLQIAYYEANGLEGLMAYKRTLEYIKANDSLSIGDIKRGDISTTANMYGRAHFEGDFEADFITLSPYMGFDSIEPYLKYLDKDKGIFVLLRTSNPGAKDIQYLKVGSPAHHLYYQVGDGLKEMASSFVGKYGYSPLGLVVGGTDTGEAKEIRARYNNMFFLIPGYGHQGARGKDVVNYLDDLNGGIVNSSRGIIRAYKDYGDGLKNFDEYARKAVLSMKEDIENEGRLHKGSNTIQ